MPSSNRRDAIVSPGRSCLVRGPACVGVSSRSRAVLQRRGRYVRADRAVLPRYLDAPRSARVMRCRRFSAARDAIARDGRPCSASAGSCVVVAGAAAGLRSCVAGRAAGDGVPFVSTSTGVTAAFITPPLLGWTAGGTVLVGTGLVATAVAVTGFDVTGLVATGATGLVAGFAAARLGVATLRAATLRAATPGAGVLGLAMLAFAMLGIAASGGAADAARTAVD